MENKIIWRGSFGEEIPEEDMDIAYDRLYGKLEILAYNNEGKPCIQRNEQWCLADAERYLPLRVRNGKNGEDYENAFFASRLQALCDSLKDLGYDDVFGHEPTFKFHPLTQRKLKNENIELNVKDVVDFGSNIIKKYCIARMKFDDARIYKEHPEHREIYSPVQKHYLDMQENYDKVMSETSTKEEKVLAELNLKCAKEGYDEYCNKTAVEEYEQGFLWSNKEKEFTFIEGMEFHPDILAKTIYNTQNKTKSATYEASVSKSKTQIHEETRTL